MLLLIVACCVSSVGIQTDDPRIAEHYSQLPSGDVSEEEWVHFIEVSMHGFYYRDSRIVTLHFPLFSYCFGCGALSKLKGFSFRE